VGTHLGEFRGIPATRRRITAEIFDIVRVAEEKIAERWTMFD
jgi:predicted ester cyclase